jgi:hypothetical protein
MISPQDLAIKTICMTTLCIQNSRQDEMLFVEPEVSMMDASKW